MKNVGQITVFTGADAGFIFGNVSLLYSKYCSINTTIGHFIIDTSAYSEEELDELLRECKNSTYASICFDDGYRIEGTIDAFYETPNGLRISIRF